MTRFLAILLATAGLVLPCVPASAQTGAPAPRHAHKAKAAKVAAPQPVRSGGINTPSTDFSTVERADDGDDSGARSPGSSVRPVMGAGGNIGFGTGF